MSLVTRVGLLNGVKRFRAVGSSLRLIATSNKKSDTAAAAPTAQDDLTKTDGACERKTTAGQWMSFGFSSENQQEDVHVTHALSFITVSVAFIFGGFILAYRPEDMNIDWAQREAFLELRRRESLGLPLIDPNYLPVDQIKLPTDEELGDAEIFI